MALTVLLLCISSLGGYAQDFRISKGDVLKITVYENDDLATSTLVSPEGVINFPLIGDVKVAGLTVAEAEREISSRLSKGYLINPHVTVLISDTGLVYVTGEVQKPGAYKVESGTTVIKAIALAGGLTEKAAPKRTKLTRKINGSESVMKVQMNDPILPGDVVNVPESFF
jgi:protein involved in polysaccharide export with SLBB domain